MSEENREIADKYAGSWWNRTEMSRAFVVMRDELGQLLDEAERRGAEKMRERAADHCGSIQHNHGEQLLCTIAYQAAKDIRALPLEGPKDSRR